MYRIAVQPDEAYLMSGRTQSFSRRWVELATQSGHEVRFVDLFRPDLREQLAGCDGFMWWFPHLPHPRNFGRRLLIAIEHGLNLPVFPNWQTVWHFDDKVSEKYLLEAAGIPMPQTWVFWSHNWAFDFCRTAQYPLVLKLAGGIVSENVRLLHNFDEAKYWMDHLFGAGVTSLERPSWRDPREASRRLRGAAKLLLKGHPPDPGERTDVQKGYFMVQEFLAGNAFDTRVTVIGNRAFAFRRFNRPNDFRASGSGRIDWDSTKIDLEIVRLAFRTARQLGTQSLAVDALYKDGRPVLTEINYYYEGWAVADCPGHWELRGDDPEAADLEWVLAHVRPDDAIFEDFITLLDARREAGAGVARRDVPAPLLVPAGS